MPGPADPIFKTPRQVIYETAAKWKVPPELALAIVEKESNGQHLKNGVPLQGSKPAVGTEHAVGYYQLLPSTAYGEFGLNPNDRSQNIEAGIRYLRQAIDRGFTTPADIGRYYHGGPDRKQHGPLTEAYGADIDRRTRALLGNQSAPPPPATADPNSLRADERTLHIGLEQRQGLGDTPIRPSAASTKPETWGEWAARHADRFVQSFDPHEQEGRRNIGGTLGSIGGGILGGAAGLAMAVPEIATGAGVAAVPSTVLWGTRLGSALGSGAGGALEQAAIEETGAGDWIEKNLPFGTTDLPRRKDAATPLGRIAAAGGEQLAGDVLGQGIMRVASGVAKRAVQSRVGKYAAEKLEDLKKLDLNALYTKLNELRSYGRDLNLEREQLGRASDSGLTEALAREAEDARIADQIEAARLKAAEQVNVRAARGAEEAARRSGAALDQQITGEVNQNIASARSAGEAGVEAARQQAADLLAQQEAAHAARTATRPDAESIGQRVIGVIEGPARDTYRALGQAVDDAADTGLPLDLTEVAARGRQIAQDELIPPEVAFPRTAAPDPNTTAGQNYAARTMAAMGEQATAAEMEAIARHPAMPIISRLLNAAEQGPIPFNVVHRFKQQLQQAVDYDSPVRDKVQAITMHLAGELRKAMSGHEPYNVATAAYEAASPAFTENFGAAARQFARSNPSLLAQIDPKNMTAVRQLHEMLTTHAEKGGAEAAAAGRQALDDVADNYLYERVLNGPLSSLGQRLTDLKKNGEFVKLLYSSELWRDRIANLELIAAAHATEKASGKASVKAAQKAGRAGVTQEIATGVAAKRQGKQTTQAAVDAARADVQKALDKKATAEGELKLGQARQDVTRAREGRAAKAAEKAAVTKKQGELATKRKETAESIQAKREDIRKRIGGSPEEIAFSRSTLNSPRARSPVQLAGDIAQAAGGLDTRWGGLGWFRTLAGVSDADMLRYIAYSPTNMRRFVKTFVGGSNAAARVGKARVPISEPAAGAVGRTLPSQVGVPPPGELFLTISASDKER